LGRRRRVGLVFGVWVLLVFVVVFGVVLNVPVVWGSGTIYIRADGSIDPSTAPIFTTDNITYTFTGSISDQIVVQRNNIIVNGNGYTLQGSGSGIGFNCSGINNVTIKNTNIKNFNLGVYLRRSNNTTVFGNTITNSTYDGVMLYSCNNNTVSRNTINTITKSQGYGVWLYSCNNTTFSRNTITKSDYGVYLRSCNYTIVSGNTITNSTLVGVILNKFSNNSIISKNTIINSNFGVWFHSCNYTTVSGNTITKSYSYGIYLTSCNYNTFFGNTITNSTWYGVYLKSCNENTFSGNTITNSKYYGVCLNYSQSNIIYHNNFINNPTQAYVLGSYYNYWDYGYPSGGNYWSDYKGPDNNFDGVGDTPYTIGDYNIDHYPLMNPWDKTPPVTTDDYDGLWHTTDFNITLTATDNFKGVAETYYKINNEEPAKNITFNGQPRITTEGANNKLEYWSVDKAGNKEIPHNILTGIKLDKTAPTGSIIINNNAPYTPSTSVTLTLTASDIASGVDKVRYSNDGTWDTEQWEPPTSTKTWTLTSGDGTKTVYYQVKDNVGFDSTYQDTIILDTIKPTANAGTYLTVNEDTLVTFDASASTDENGISTYTWTFTDVTPQTLTGKNPTYTFATPGIYTITLTVTDPAGNSATDTVIVIVLDVTKPTANAGPDQTVNEDTLVTFDASASSDNLGIANYIWTFTDAGVLKTLEGKNPTYTFQTPGIYTVTLKATDAASNYATDTVTITVVDVTKPSANAGSDRTVNVGATVSFDASASSDNVGIVSYQWDFGDGTTGTGKTTTHTYANPGTYTVTLTVKDAANNSATHSITITVLSTEGFPMWTIAAGAVIAAIGIAIAVLLLRKRK